MNAGDASERLLAPRVAAVVGDLERAGSARVRDEMGPRYGLYTTKAFGVAMAGMKSVAKGLGRDHALAAALWETGLHGRLGAEAPTARYLELIEDAAGDERNFVKKGVSWALRALGRGAGDRHDAAVALARRLAASADRSARWIGKDAIRELARSTARSSQSRAVDP